MRYVLALLALLLGAPASGQGPAAPPAGRVETTVAGRPYVVLGATKNVSTIRYQGEDWTQLKVWKGDRRAEDPASVDRIGLDGWVKLYRWGAPVDLTVRVILRENALPERGGWLNLFETHEKNWNGVGFIKLMLEWSDGLKRPVMRLRAGDTVIWTDDRPVQYQPYHVRLRFTAGGPGYVQAWVYGRQVADWRGYVGHGPKWPLYPQFRIYRSAEKRTATVFFRVDRHDER